MCEKCEGREKLLREAGISLASLMEQHDKLRETLDTHDHDPDTFDRGEMREFSETITTFCNEATTDIGRLAVVLSLIVGESPTMILGGIAGTYMQLEIARSLGINLDEEENDA